MNKAYEVADRLMEWVSSLLHRITGESSPVWDRIVYGILVFVIAIVVARILRMIVIYVIHRIIKYKGGDLLKGLVEAKVFTGGTIMVSDINKLGLDVKWKDLTPGCTIVGSCTAWTSRRRRSGYHLCNRVP